MLEAQYIDLAIAIYVLAIAILMDLRHKSLNQVQKTPNLHMSKINMSCIFQCFNHNNNVATHTRIRVQSQPQKSTMESTLIVKTDHE
ncbi:hypothetical protein LguiA_013223 [Lonicera macranthoides]